MLLAKINELQNLWKNNKERYLKAERGSQGNEGFVKEFLVQILELTETHSLQNSIKTFKNQLGTGQNNRTADFVLYPSQNVLIPLEVEKLGNIKAGMGQLLNYQSDLQTSYGILTDGQVWRFFNNSKYIEFELEKDIFDDFDRFQTFWEEYTKSESYYISYFKGELSAELGFEDYFRPKVEDNQDEYFKQTTHLVAKFKDKLINNKVLPNAVLQSSPTDNEKLATEMSYSYLIQFILFKTLVDNNFLEDSYKDYLAQIRDSLEKQNYKNIIPIIKQITDTVGSQIYKPFFKDQEDINKSLTKLIFELKNELTDVALFLDIIIYTDRFDFGGLSGDIFGYIYENYLKELYSDENKGQYFTDPKIAELMLGEMDWTVENLTLKLKNNEFGELSLIDPACGSGTFLYSATRTLIKAGQKANLDSKKIIDLVIDNIVGFDVEEFPLYLAEMNILMRLLPIIYTDPKNPQAVEKRLKIFWTEDSLSEFVSIQNHNQTLAKEKEANPLFENDLPYPYQKFMRDENELNKLKEDLLDTKRQKFDYVIANPPYIGYNECSKMGIKYFNTIKKKELKLNNVFGVNLHSTPDRHKKYSPKPNLYAFFLALNNTLLKSNGQFCFIIPQTLLTAGDLDVVRYFLTSNFQIQKLITFQNNLFIDRGVKQTKQVATSSLIILAKKSLKNANTQVLNYHKSEATMTETKSDLLTRKNCKVKKIPQSELLAKYENWNWIKHNLTELAFYQKYLQNSQSLEIYYNHKKAQKEFGDKFWFDKGLVFPKDKIKNTKSDYQLIKLGKKFEVQYLQLWISKESVTLPKGSQGFEVFEQKYKIIWSYMNPNKFLISNKQVIILFNQVVISSNNFREILYLQSVLNSTLSWKIFDLQLSSKYEQALILGIKTIKNYIRIPILDTPDKLKQKQELIQLAGELLDCEKVVLGDLIDFDSVGVLPPKFTKWEIKDQNLVLDSKFSFVIISEQSLIEEILTKEIIGEFGLNQLQNLPIFDKPKQDKIKIQMDEIVYKLYQMENLEYGNDEMET